MSRESSVPRATYADERTSPAVGPAAGTASGSAVSTPSTVRVSSSRCWGGRAPPARAAALRGRRRASRRRRPTPGGRGRRPPVSTVRRRGDGLVEPGVGEPEPVPRSAMVWSSRWAEAIWRGATSSSARAPSPARSRPLLPRPRRPSRPRPRCRCGAGLHHRLPAPADSPGLLHPHGDPLPDLLHPLPERAAVVSLMASANRLCACTGPGPSASTGRPA